VSLSRTPQGYVVSTECRKAATDNGFRRFLGEDDGWFAFGSTTAEGRIWLTASSEAGPWLLSIDHSGVLREAAIERADLEGPGIARFAFGNLKELYAALSSIYELSVTLPFPNNPIDVFNQAIKGMPRITEAEGKAVQRIGQDIYRDGLISFWHGRCPLTGIREPELLRASHAKPWRDCEADVERLDVYNGLLLSALWDAAFDKGMVTFSEGGEVVCSKTLGDAARKSLLENATNKIELVEKHQDYMQWHRNHIFR
jgi:hypothetical protein